MKKNNISNYARFSGIAFQMGGTIFAGAYLGKWLDSLYPMEKKWFTIALTLLSVAAALYNVLRQVNKINQEQDEEKK